MGLTTGECKVVTKSLAPRYRGGQEGEGSDPYRVGEFDRLAPGLCPVRVVPGSKAASTTDGAAGTEACLSGGSPTVAGGDRATACSRQAWERCTHERIALKHTS